MIPLLLPHPFYVECGIRSITHSRHILYHWPTFSDQFLWNKTYPPPQMYTTPVESETSFHKGITLRESLSRRGRQMWGVASASRLIHLGGQMEPWVIINNIQTSIHKTWGDSSLSQITTMLSQDQMQGRLGYSSCHVSYGSQNIQTGLLSPAGV